MSRRKEEFAHRTSIFEGAFRAWSYLGSLDPAVVTSTAASDLDPLAGSCGQATTEGTTSSVYPYEPLPRAGLGHTFVQAILPPWLGPTRDANARTLGLSTLRTWWQHRRKGESPSARQALAKLQRLVDKYTLHFFQLAHCLVVHDQEQPPRSLMQKMHKNGGGGRRKGGSNSAGGDNSNSSINSKDNGDDNSGYLPQQAAVSMRGKCVPGKIDLEGLVDAVQQNLASMAMAGNNNSGGGKMGNLHREVSVSSRDGMGSSDNPDMDNDNGVYTPIIYAVQTAGGAAASHQTMVFQIALTISGLVCPHCVKIVETVLLGCKPGAPSPIDGLLDVVADQQLDSLLIRIQSAADAPRVAQQAARNLKLVGYDAKPRTLLSLHANSNASGPPPLPVCTTDQVQKSCIALGEQLHRPLFDWSPPCSCPPTGVQTHSCARHSKMNGGVVQAFELRQRQVLDLLRNQNDPNALFAIASEASAIIGDSIDNDLRQTGRQQQQQLGYNNGGMGGFPPNANISDAHNNDEYGMLAEAAAAAAAAVSMDDNTHKGLVAHHQQQQMLQQQQHNSIMGLVQQQRDPTASLDFLASPLDSSNLHHQGRYPASTLQQQLQHQRNELFASPAAASMQQQRNEWSATAAQNADILGFDPQSPFNGSNNNTGV